jgi:glycine cleavage system aminomethyltransferase T
VALFGQTSFSKFMVLGADAATVLGRICANDIDVEPGRSVYGAWLNERGGIEADLTVNRISEQEFMVITTVGSAVGMGYVTTSPGMSRAEVLDAPFEVQVNGQRYSATASHRPFYDPTSGRTRM